MAKESVVSTLSVLFGSTEALLGVITPAAAASLLVFCLLYTPCVAAIASIRRELGGKWAAGVVIGELRGSLAGSGRCTYHSDAAVKYNRRSRCAK